MVIISPPRSMSSGRFPILLLSVEASDEVGVGDASVVDGCPFSLGAGVGSGVDGLHATKDVVSNVKVKKRVANWKKRFFMEGSFLNGCVTMDSESETLTLG